MERELPSQTSNVQGNWMAMLSDETARVVDRGGRVEQMHQEINNFNRMKKIQNVRETQHDTGWFSKQNELLNIDFDDSERNF